MVGVATLRGGGGAPASVRDDCAAMDHRTLAELEAGLAAIVTAPDDAGTVELIARRPAEDLREALEEAEFDLVEGLRGDNWLVRGSTRTPDGRAHPEAQVTIMSARAAALIAGPRERWMLAGDQIYVDLDLGEDNLPVGTRLRLGTAVLEVTAKPHLGCAKFSARFGTDALRFVNSADGRALRVRGVNARVLTPGTVRRGATVHKVAPGLSGG